MRARIIWVLIISLTYAAGGLAGTKAEKNFRKLSAEILQNFQEFWPVQATAMGVHKHDNEFADYSSGNVVKQRKKLRKFLARLYKYKSVGLPLDMDINRRLLRGNCEIAMLRLAEVRYHEINPNLYLNDASKGIYFILVHDYAPLGERVANIIARMNALPQFLQQGESNLKDPPPLWLSYAIDNITSVIEFYQTVTGQLTAQFPDRSPELNEASAKAIRALDKFKSFLENLAPGEIGSFAIGEDYFNYILKHQYYFDFDADSMLQIGERLLAESQDTYRKYREKMAEAGLLDTEEPVFVPASISRQDVLDYYNWEIEAVKQFFVDRDLITIPEDLGICEAVETPVFLRGVIGRIAYEPPGQFDAATTGYFYVPPIPDDLTDEQKKGYYLQMHGRGFRGSVVHEAYPGHHLQLQLAARIKSEVRRWQMNNTLTEGWGLYCEELAYDAGLYEDNPAAYLKVLRGVLFRAARIVIDVKLQTGQFDYDQAVAWMSKTLDTDKTGWIKREVLRYTTDPGQPMSYLMGKRAVVELREIIKEREGEAFNLKSFHDRLLAEGSIPISLIREKMLK